MIDTPYSYAMILFLVDKYKRKCEICILGSHFIDS